MRNASLSYGSKRLRELSVSGAFCSKTTDISLQSVRGANTTEGSKFAEEETDKEDVVDVIPNLDQQEGLNMSDSDEQTLNLRKLEAEIEKLAAERQKLQRETAATRGTQWRAWIVSLSVVVSIGVSAFGMYQTLTEIAFKNRQLGLQSEVQSNEVFLNQVLDRMSGIKVIHSGVDSETGEWITKSEDTYGDVIQVGSYGAAVALACRFDNLKLAAESALTFQLAAQRTDIFAQDMLARLESGCLPGWDQLTEQERSAWFHDQDRNQRD